jgi:hypothetical protein
VEKLGWIIRIGAWISRREVVRRRRASRHSVTA